LNTLAILLLNIMGSPNIGVYALATDGFMIIPGATPETKTKKIQLCLNVKPVKTNIGGVRLIGALVGANSHGLILPHYVKDEELSILESNGIKNYAIMETKKTAYGNMILANDHGAVVDPSISTAALNRISETLQVEAVPGTIAGYPYVGSLAIATNKGILAHPLIKEDEKKVLEDALKVPLDVGTVNCGFPLVRSGLMANSHGVITGAMTTGPELVIIGQTLGI
jgi:translation initiation factor 6